MTVHSFWQQSLGEDASVYYSASRLRVLDDLMWPSGRDGVRLVAGASLQVQANDLPDMQVLVDPGWARQAGYLACNDAVAAVDIPDADPALARIDRVVMQWTDTEAGDAVSDGDLVVLEGDPGASPAPPSLTGLKVCPLAKIFVAAGASGINPADITDERTLVGAADLGRAMFRQITLQNLPHDGTLATLTGFQRIFDTLGLGYAAGVLTVQQDGWYELSGRVGADAPGVTLVAAIRVNGVQVVNNKVPGDNNAVCPVDMVEVFCEAGDTIDMVARSSPALSTLATEISPEFASMLRVKRIG